MTEYMRERMARQMLFAFLAFMLFIGFLAFYQEYVAQRKCSADGYFVPPIYQNGLPVRCKRLPL